MPAKKRLHALGFDIGGTKCAAILGRAEPDGGIAILQREAFPTPRSAPRETVAALFAAARAILARHDLVAGELAAVGISCGGPLDAARGLILSPPNLPGWDEVPIAELCRREFSVPAHLQNDANACALAEWRYGAGRGTSNMVFCTFGTGFGAGLILGGRLYEGTNGMAGEIGHVRLAQDGPVGYGKSGSVEGFCSGGGLAQLAKAYVRAAWARGERVDFCSDTDALELITAQSVAAAACRGDATAAAVYREAGRRLGQALAVLVDLINPELIVIGSIFARQRELLWPEAERVLAAEALDRSRAVCRVVPALLGEAIGDYASLAVAFHE